VSADAKLAFLALFAPAASALFLVLFPWVRFRGLPAALVTIAGSLASFGAALSLALNRQGVVHFVVPWVQEKGRAVIEVGVHIDDVAAPMLVIVTVVALCVQIFSLSYMHDEKPRAYGRYFAYQALFLFAMNLLVVAPNLFELFAGWELVGLASYLLIGFWYEKPSAAKAAVKAFWMTKLGDMGFLFGLLWLYVDTGSFDWTAQASVVTATAVTALLFFAVMGKSAQFPLHIWLPDAMEGPTPVSALLHAATMVAAGVYLVVRADPLFALAPMTRDAMVWVGAITAVFAALLALVQTDLKKVLAFSTCSQLGYMVTALGAGSAFAGFFHLGTHAFFKALLFLAAGSVIHAVHTNEIAQMGGLRKKMPLTTLAFGIGALSLAGVPPFAGFFSKDLVLHTLEGRMGWVPWTMLMASAFLTAFYMGRVLIKAFFGAPSAKAAHAHEGGPALWGPLVVLMVPAVGSGFLGGHLAEGMKVEYSTHLLSLTPIVATTMGLTGLLAAVLVFGRGGTAPLAGVLTRLDQASLVDRGWELLYRSVLLGLARIIGWFDRYVVDGVMNAIGYAAIEVGVGVRRLQTGFIRDYAFAVALGVVVLALWGTWK
jgi:proton-translocating NADH-quinone oxidoreductase chain L